MKWSQVSVDGIYTKPPKSQLSYGALLGGTKYPLLNI